MENETLDTLALGHLQADLRDPKRSLEEAMSEVDRELSVRVRCFSRWVADRKLAAMDAKDRLERLVAAFHFLQTLAHIEAEHAGTDPHLDGRMQAANPIPAELPALTPQGK